MARTKKIREAIPRGKVYIHSSFNNTIVTVTDPKGNVLSWASTGTAGYSGTQKSTPYAAQLTANQAIQKAKAYGLKEVDVFVRGIGSGRESAIRSLQHTGLTVLSLKDVTPMPHNGTRARKPRRV